MAELHETGGKSPGRFRPGRRGRVVVVPEMDWGDPNANFTGGLVDQGTVDVGKGAAQSGRVGQQGNA